MQALLLTNEYPPNVYGGAGVHVEYLTRELAKLIDVDVRTFGEQDVARARCGSAATRSPRPVGTPQSCGRCSVRSVGDRVRRRPVDADVVHCHTWYATSAESSRRSRTASRSSSPSIRWSRCDRGSGSSWAAATTHRRGSSGRRSRWPTRSSRCRRARARTCSPISTSRERIASSTTGSTSTNTGRRRRPTPSSATASTRPAVRAVRRPDHAPEGDRAPGPGDPAYRAGDCDRAVRRRAGHAGDRRRDGGGRAGGPGVNPNVHWIAEMVDEPTVRQLYSHAAVFAARRCTSRSGSSTSRRWRARRRSWQRRGRHPGSGRGRRDRAAGAVRTCGWRVIRAQGSRTLRARPCVR